MPISLQRLGRNPSGRNRRLTAATARSRSRLMIVKNLTSLLQFGPGVRQGAPVLITPRSNEKRRAAAFPAYRRHWARRCRSPDASRGRRFTTRMRGFEKLARLGMKEVALGAASTAKRTSSLKPCGSTTTHQDKPAGFPAVATLGRPKAFLSGRCRRGLLGCHGAHDGQLIPFAVVGLVHTKQPKQEADQPEEHA